MKSLSILSHRAIFAVLDLMKLDMANFAVSSIRPHLMQQSVEYERNKFQDFFDKQPGMNSVSFMFYFLENHFCDINTCVCLWSMLLAAFSSGGGPSIKGAKAHPPLSSPPPMIKPLLFRLWIQVLRHLWALWWAVTCSSPFLVTMLPVPRHWPDAERISELLFYFCKEPEFAWW